MSELDKQPVETTRLQHREMKKLKSENVVRHGGWVLFLPNSRTRRDNREMGKSNIKKLRLPRNVKTHLASDLVI